MALAAARSAAPADRISEFAFMPESLRPPRAPRPWSRRAAVLLVVACAATGCGPIAAPERGEGPGGRPQQLALSPQEEYRLGTEAFQQVLQEARSKGVLVRGGP